MTTVILVIHVLLTIALIAVILLQRSEGGALGIGGGGGGSGFMSGRATANVLTRATAILAGLFFLTSIVLAILAGHRDKPRSIVDQPVGSAPAAPASSMPATPAAPAEPAQPEQPAAPKR
jgi:preprotein translocase subunit SecG